VKLKCIRTRDAFRRSVSSSPWYTVGETYIVLALSVTKTNGVQVRMIGDDAETPTLFRFSDFQIVEGKLPPNWIVIAMADEGFELTPEPWSRKGFWDRFFNGDVEAKTVFERERDIINNS
jgi:hypothetical protein